MKGIGVRTVGVITEYNPFHNGHRYQLEKIREKTDADYIIAVMSGDFLQRGMPAATDKYTRTQMALYNGADLVLELPALWATASAEYFASAGVALLGNTKMTNTIAYGLETPNPSLIKELAGLLQNPPASFDKELSALQKKGLSYPAARSLALSTLLPDYSPKELNFFLSQPNNILAVEYEKAIAKWNKSNSNTIEGLPIPRIGDGYHTESPKTIYASATAIRKMLFSDDNYSAELDNYLPPDCAALLREAKATGTLLNEDDFSMALYERLLALRPRGYENFADCSRDLSYRIANLLHQFVSFRQFCSLLKTKDTTYTRISRVLIHILLDITKESYALASPVITYLRVLGFRRASSPLLSAIKKKGAVPMITKMADAHRLLSPDAHPLLDLDIYAADLYRGVAAIHFGTPLPNEFTQQLIIL